MTYIDLINRVLRRLREDTVVTSTETDYSRVVADIISEIHQECVSEHDWSSMRHEITLALIPSQKAYNLGLTIANGGNVPNTQRITNNDSYVVFDENNAPMAWLFADTSDDQGDQMIMVAPTTMETLHQRDRDLTNELPYHFSYRLHPSNEGLELSVWPLPTVAKTVRLVMWTPSSELVPDGTMDNTTLLVPWRPIYLGALMLAQNERGEEIGEPGHLAERRYYKALAKAIEADMATRVRTDQLEVVRD